jgi:hypothetical protein
LNSGRFIFWLLALALIIALPSECISAEQNSWQRLADLELFLKHGRGHHDGEGVRFRLGSEIAKVIDLWDSDNPRSGKGAGAPIGGEKNVTTDWTPYNGPFEMQEAAHLLHRTVFGTQWEELESAVQNGLSTELDMLLAPQPAPDPPGDWATEPFPDISDWDQEMIDSLVALYRDRGYILQLWWAETMLEQSTSITESMTLFWHDHFATGISKVVLPQSMYVQNDLFRQNALGNFRELVRQVVSDPAMLLWLDGQVNRVGNINENFARELLELFTLGLDQYTQEDIVEAARALTGWVTYDGITSTLVSEYHDHGYKIFLGQGGLFNSDNIVDIIFQQDETARFICRKLYRWFIDEFPDELLIEDLAQTLRDNDYETLPVLQRMLSSEHFFDVNFRGSLITDGMDKTSGVLRGLYIEDPDLSSHETNPGIWVLFSMQTYGQMLFEPPNVAGWPGYRTWINSYTLPWRKRLDVGVIDGYIGSFDMQMQADVLGLANRLTDPNDPYALINDLALYFFGMPPTELVSQRMLDELLQGAEPWEWNINHPLAESRLRDLIKLIMRLPDYQLK